VLPRSRRGELGLAAGTRWHSRPPVRPSA